jgi:chitodextrinase
VISSSTSYTDNTTGPNVAYSYQVEAFDAASNASVFSSPVSVTTPKAIDTTPPSTPMGLTASAISTTQINLSWSSSTDNVGVTGYEVFRNGTLLATVNATTFGDSGLTPSTLYTYYVKAVDGSGNLSLASANASSTTQAIPTPSVGTLTGIVDHGSASTDRIEGATIYYVVNGIQHSTTSNSEGVYTLTNVPVGNITVNYEATGYVSTYNVITILNGQTVTKYATLTVSTATVTPPPPTSKTGTLTGIVDHGNKSPYTPISGATVYYTYNGVKHQTTTNTSGDYTLSNVPVGNITVYFSATGYAATDNIITILLNQTVVKAATLTAI